MIDNWGGVLCFAARVFCSVEDRIQGLHMLGSTCSTPELSFQPNMFPAWRNKVKGVNRSPQHYLPEIRARKEWKVTPLAPPLWHLHFLWEVLCLRRGFQNGLGLFECVFFSVAHPSPRSFGTQSWPPSALGWSLLVTGPRPGPAIAAHASGCGHLSPFLLCKACKPCPFLRGEVGLPQLG